MFSVIPRVPRAVPGPCSGFLSQVSEGRSTQQSRLPLGGGRPLPEPRGAGRAVKRPVVGGQPFLLHVSPHPLKRLVGRVDLGR